MSVKRKVRLWVCPCCRYWLHRKKDDVGNIKLRKATEKLAGSIVSGTNVIGKSTPRCTTCRDDMVVAREWPKGRVRPCSHRKERAEQKSIAKVLRRQRRLGVVAAVSKSQPKETVSMSKKKAVEKYEQKHGKKFKCGDVVKKEAYVTKNGDGGWRVRCHKHHTASCKKIMRRLRKAA